jgi:hypothetical protein
MIPQGEPWFPLDPSFVRLNTFIKSSLKAMIIFIKNKGGVQGEPWFPLFMA